MQCLKIKGLTKTFMIESKYLIWKGNNQNWIKSKIYVKKININHYPLIIAGTYYKGIRSCCSSSCSKKGITFCFICQAYLLVKKVQWFTVEPSLEQVFLRFVDILSFVAEKRERENTTSWWLLVVGDMLMRVRPQGSLRKRTCDSLLSWGEINK